jgi:predicted nucleic acid-binding protein
MFKVIVDTNVFGDVFNPDLKNFNNFHPVRNCITSPKCKGILVYGGSKFKHELSSFSYRKKIFKILRDIGRLQELDDSQVDNLCNKLKRIEPCRAFNDEHLIACVILSGSKVIVTDDKRADRYLKDDHEKFYNHPSERPKIYRDRKKHFKIFSDCCK